jgi:hypothetical protein
MLGTENDTRQAAEEDAPEKMSSSVVAQQPALQRPVTFIGVRKGVVEVLDELELELSGSHGRCGVRPLKCSMKCQSVVVLPIPSPGSPYSCVQELAKHDLDGAKLHGKVSKHMEVNHGNQVSVD